MSLLILVLSAPFIVGYLALRDHSRARRAGQPEGAVGLAVRLWAWRQVAEPLVFLAVVLYFLFLFIGYCIVTGGTCH